MLIVANTDYDWFKQLSSYSNLNIINFWTPTPWNLNNNKIIKGTKLYFLLKKPYRKIAGYGEFSYYTNLSVSDVWNKYGKYNGVSSYNELLSKTTEYAKRNSVKYNLNAKSIIGCIVLDNPIFFDEEQFIAPEDCGIKFAPQIVTRKYFELDKLSIPNISLLNNDSFQLVTSNEIDFSNSRKKKREGQNIFRRAVLSAYGNKCTITGESCKEVLEASHIQVYINKSSNHVQNGIALRIDLHKLFDAGLISIDDNYIIHISPYLQSENYMCFDGKKINLPLQIGNNPSKLALSYHYKNTYRY